MSRDADAVSVPQFAARATDRCQAPESPLRISENRHIARNQTWPENRKASLTPKQPHDPGAASQGATIR